MNDRKNVDLDSAMEEQGLKWNVFLRMISNNTGNSNGDLKLDPVYGVNAARALDAACSAYPEYDRSQMYVRKMRRQD